MSTEEIDTVQATQPPQPYSTPVRVLRAIGLAFSTGMIALFVCRDLLHTDPAVYFTALAIGAVLGVALELAADAVRLDQQRDSR